MTLPPLPPSFLAALTRAVEARGGTPVQGGKELRFRCPDPNHEDVHPSARWNPEKGTWWCDSRHEGGGAIDLARLLGVDLPDQHAGHFGPGRGGAPRRAAFTASPIYYEYHDEKSQPLYRVVRRDGRGGKQIHQERWTGTGWASGATGVRLVPYRLPELLASQPAEPVFVVEGEKCTDALAGIGYIATTNPQGAGKWRADFAPHFKDRLIIVIPDNDEPGRRHAESIVASLGPVAKTIQIVILPGLPEKGDIADWLAMGHTRADLAELVDADPAPWSPGHTNGSERIEDIEQDDWPEIIPLATGPLPEFPVPALGPTVAPFVEALAVSSATPRSLPACVGLGVLSASLGGKYVVDAGGDWVEPVNLYLLALQESGTRKSSVFRTACRPVIAFEREQTMSDRAEHSRWEAKRKIAERDYDAAIKKSDSGLPTDALLAEAAKVDLDGMRPPRITQIIYDDITPEGLSKELADQDGALAVMSPEGGFIGNMAGRYTSAPNFEVLLKAHAGDELRVKRVGREGEYVARPALTVCIAAQPTIAAEMGRVQGFRSKGAAARFLPSLPASTLGNRAVQPPPMPPAIAEAWRVLVHTLLNIQRSSAGDRANDRQPCALRLSHEARSILLDFEYEIEPQLGQDGELSGIADWASKLPGASLRIAGLLHVAGCVAMSAPVGSTIEAETMTRSLEIARYFIPHALTFFEQVEQSGYGAARQVLSKLLEITDSETGSTTRRKLHQLLKQRQAFKVGSALDAPLRLLEDYGYVRIAKVTGPDGGRPTEIITVNPHAQSPRNTQNPRSKHQESGYVDFVDIEHGDWPDAMASE